MSEASFHQNFNLFFDGLQLPRKSTDRTEHMPLDTLFGEGSIRRIVPRFDMEVVVSEYTFYENRTLTLSPKASMVELSYCFQGEREVSFAGSRYEFTEGTCTLQFLNRQDEIRFDFTANKPFLLLGIGIPISTFHHFMEDDSGERAVDFDRILDGRGFRAFQDTIDPAATVMLNRIVQASRVRGTKNFEMECAVMELLSSAFRSFLFDGNPESPRLSKDDMDKIRIARRIMLERMAEPPTLIELSRMIGMNDYKLKIGFKEMYGTTVFGYLRDKRLEQALRLLQAGSITVIEASCAVGYNNPSYFAEVFREKYGVNPGELVRRPSASR
ncbi:helix-turn-helix transcriptional regulator [Paenibacillus contaminans]|uniref:AraC family transcriptional regulator n=1 Tax=Paenibacillus contaminans TaxID=450362 RepID=A0A329MS59_9BACL|nr:AraC family transcriptional regulator [Paenibacillus contaminans]RAV22811.1 AraC family transcriptional regulator [Paenibacillus contaminans]